jgi:DNA replication initiation complex subunit (GINS family)
MKIKVGLLRQLIRESLGIDTTLSIKNKFESNINDFIKKAREVLNLKSPDDMTPMEQGLYLKVVERISGEMLEVLLRGLQELNQLPKNEEVDKAPAPLQINP